MNWILVFGGVFAVGFFLVLGTGLFLAIRKLKRSLQNMMYLGNIQKKPEHLELINTFIEDKTPIEFKKEMLLLNLFSEAEIRMMVYAFTKIQINRKKAQLKQVKGGEKKSWLKMMRK